MSIFCLLSKNSLTIRSEPFPQTKWNGVHFLLEYNDITSVNCTLAKNLSSSMNCFQPLLTKQQFEKSFNFKYLKIFLEIKRKPGFCRIVLIGKMSFTLGFLVRETCLFPEIFGFMLRVFLFPVLIGLTSSTLDFLVRETWFFSEIFLFMLLVRILICCCFFERLNSTVTCPAVKGQTRASAPKKRTLWQLTQRFFSFARENQQIIPQFLPLR